MDQDSPTMPSATPSEVSTGQPSSHERSSPIMVPSSSPEPEDFKPHQMLMQTPITIECGPNLSTKLTVHEELLRCHSRLLDGRFTKAKMLRQQYEEANTLHNQIAAHVFPEVTADEFEAENHHEKALFLIVSAYESYPLRTYQDAIRKLILDATQEEVQSKRVKNRMLHNAIRESNTKIRITYINPRGMQAITAKLFGGLHKINKCEIVKAEKDVVRAAAQKRILIPGVDKDTVRLAMQWIYQGKLECDHPQKLYDTLQLALQLGIEALAEFCHTKLHNTAKERIQNAMVTQTSIKSLLGYGPGQSDNVIEVVFKHALKDHDAPKRLQQLVVATLATDLDTALWAELKDQISHSIALQLIEAMVGYRQQVVAGTLDYGDIKFENGEANLLSPFHGADE